MQYGTVNIELAHGHNRGVCRRNGDSCWNPGAEYRFLVYKRLPKRIAPMSYADTEWYLLLLEARAFLVAWAQASPDCHLFRSETPLNMCPISAKIAQLTRQLRPNVTGPNVIVTQQISQMFWIFPIRPMSIAVLYLPGVANTDREVPFQEVADWNPVGFSALHHDVRDMLMLEPLAHLF